MPAGRPPGSKNINKGLLLEALQAKYGKDFNPVLKMAAAANKLQLAADKTEGADQLVLQKAVIEAWDKIAPYTTPKLSSVEISGELDLEVKDHAAAARKKIEAGLVSSAISDKTAEDT